MALLGRTNRLTVNRFVDFGAYLDGGDDGEILLPRKYLAEGVEEGDKLDVFVHRDSEDRLVATTEEPRAEVGDCAFLEVVQVNKFGAFLDWGLEKDLFVPFGEQRSKMKVGQRYVVYVYLDNTDRIAATSKLRKFLAVTSSDYKPGDEVELIVTAVTDLGYEVAVDDMVLGMIFENDVLVPLRVGRRMSGYVKHVRPDRKLDISLQPPAAPEVRDDLAARILRNLRENGGTSSLTDKSPPEAIFAAYGVSKRVYKAALGGLYKDRRIVIKRGTVELADSD